MSIDEKDIQIQRRFNEDKLFIVMTHKPTGKQVFDYGNNETSLKKRLMKHLEERIKE